LLLLTLVTSSLSSVCVISIIRVTFLQNTSTDITCKKPFSSSAPNPWVTVNATAYPPASYFASRTKLVDNRSVQSRYLRLHSYLPCLPPPLSLD
jgi:hypothetical protein